MDERMKVDEGMKYYNINKSTFMKIKSLLLAIFSVLTISLSAQDFSQIGLSNMIYAEGVHSVQLYCSGYQFGLPILKLGSDEKLVLEFDDLERDDRYLKYTFIHCSHDWKPESMNQIEYLEGFLEDEITEQSYSFNTIQSYTHYRLVFPGELMRIRRSGNYILYVYDDTPDNPVLTRRFAVLEPTVAEVIAEVRQSSDVSTMYEKQEVDFWVNTGAWQVRNPAQYLHATILQNGRWDEAITGLLYRSGKPGEYSFDYDDNSNAFNGGSEFRVFDTKSLKYNGARVVSSGLENGELHAFVLEDLARPYGPYVSGTTASGRCYYKTEDFEGENREEYVNTHFTLRSDYPLDGGKAFVFGELTDWRILPEAELQFNEAMNYWETTLLLKQGYYNYEYVFVPKGKKEIDVTKIEGNHWETGNEYCILVYLLDDGGAYDRLIGVTSVQMGK